MNSEATVLTLPILPIKRTVLFPGVMMPLTIGRERSMAAVNAAMKTEEKMILVVAQRDPQTDEPGLADLHPIGTKAIIRQVAQSPEGTIHAMVQGLDRVVLIEAEQTTPYMTARVRALDRPSDSSTEEDPVALAYRIASLVNLTVAEEQKLLETSSTAELLRGLYAALSREIQILQVRDKITSEAQAKIGKNQREYILREQLKAIQQELGESDGEEHDIAHLKKQIQEADLPTLSGKKPSGKWRASGKCRRPRRTIRCSGPIWNSSSNCPGRKPPRIIWISPRSGRCSKRITTASRK